MDHGMEYVTLNNRVKMPKLGVIIIGMSRNPNAEYLESLRVRALPVDFMLRCIAVHSIKTPFPAYFMSLRRVANVIDG